MSQAELGLQIRKIVARGRFAGTSTDLPATRFCPMAFDRPSVKTRVLRIVPYPFTAPTVMPAMIWRWKSA